MLDLVTNFGYYIRDYARYFIGATVLALALLLAGLLTLAPGSSQTDSVNSLDQLHRAGPGTALADNRIAHAVRTRVARRTSVGRIPPPPEPSNGGNASEPGAQLVTAVTPGAPAPAAPPPPGAAPDAPKAPLPQAPESPAPNPKPTPKPQPEPSAPEPSPPPPAPAEPVPAPNPPPPPPPEPPPPQPDGQVLFRGTFDSSFKGWYVQSIPGRATTSTDDPFEGARAARFEVRDGDVEPDTGSERSEVSGPTFDEGQDLYIRDAIRVPSSTSFDGSWQIIQQLHETDWGGSPGIAVFLGENNALTLGAGDGSPTYWRSAPLEHDRWHDLIYRVYLSQNASEGFVEVWLDGDQQALLNGSTRMYGQTIQTEHTYIKAGIYRGRSSTGTSLVEHDSIVIGTSLAAVLGG